MTRHCFFFVADGTGDAAQGVSLWGKEGEVGFSPVVNEPPWFRRGRLENNSRWLWGC